MKIQIESIFNYVFETSGFLMRKFKLITFQLFNNPDFLRENSYEKLEVSFSYFWNNEFGKITGIFILFEIIILAWKFKSMYLVF